MDALISSRALCRLFETSPVPLTLASPQFEDCPLMHVNDAFLELTGYERHEIIGRNCRFLQGADSDVVSRNRLRSAIQHRTAALVNILNYRKDGTPFENLVFLRPIFGSDGQPIYYLGSQHATLGLHQMLTALEHASLLDEALDLLARELSRKDRLYLRERDRFAEAVHADGLVN